MNRFFIIFFIIFLISCQSSLDTKKTRKISNDEKLSIFNQEFSNFPNEDKNLTFYNEKYILVWSKIEKNNVTLEFIKQDETLDNYTKMITYVSPPNELSFDKYLNLYLQFIKNYQLSEPRIYKNKKSIFKKDYVIDVGLVDMNNDRFEHVFNRVYLDNSGQVNSITLSTVYKLSIILKDTEMSKELGDKKFEWLSNFDKIIFTPFLKE